jgi:hypothetical protein
MKPLETDEAGKTSLVQVCYDRDVELECVELFEEKGVGGTKAGNGAWALAWVDTVMEVPSGMF